MKKQRAITDGANAEVVRSQQQAGSHQMSSDSSLAVTEELRQTSVAAVSAADDARSTRGRIAKYESACSSVSETLVAERAAKITPPASLVELAATTAEVERLRRELRDARADCEAKAMGQIK